MNKHKVEIKVYLSVHVLQIQIKFTRNHQVTNGSISILAYIFAILHLPIFQLTYDISHFNILNKYTQSIMKFVTYTRNNGF